MSHTVAIEILETELELINSILKYYDVEKTKLRNQGFSIMDASYRHWSMNKAKLMIKRVHLERSIVFLKEEEENY
jgi:hypothetical protein